MRKLFILLILIMSCSNQDSPSDLMSEEQMVNFLLDINIINSSRAYRNNSDLNYYNIKDTFLYKKHNIDSLQFVNSNKYYSSNPKQYLRILKPQVKDLLNFQAFNLSNANKYYETAKVPPAWP